MGNDGGSIPTRREILSYNTQELSKLKNGTTSNSDVAYSKQSNSWSHCKLSFESIFTDDKNPVVSDYLGNLYLKEKVLEYILKREPKPNFEHLRSIKDMVELKVSYDDKNRIVCPLSSLTIDVNEKKIPPFVYIVPCGCLMGKKILLELIKSGASKKSGDKQVQDLQTLETLPGFSMKCPVCQEEFDTSDVIDINSNDTKVLERLENRLQKLKERGLSHSLKTLKKKDKKMKKRNAEDYVGMVKKRVKS